MAEMSFLTALCQKNLGREAEAIAAFESGRPIQHITPFLSRRSCMFYHTLFIFLTFPGFQCLP